MTARSVVALSGGVGGARLVDGLAGALSPDELTVIVNTGDDLVHWGLRVSPDLDTIMYTLAGLGDERRGWGLAEDSFRALAMIERYGGPIWFALGDRDLATHLTRTQRLAEGATLSEVTGELCQALGVLERIAPMSDASRPTMIDTRTHGTLPFQRWLVHERATPPVTRVWFDGPPEPAPGVIDAIAGADVIVIGPSNPYVSIDPILSLTGVRDALVARRAAGVPIVGVSPIVGGRAVKGPLATMIAQLAERPPSAGAVAAHYSGLLTAFVVERGDGDDPALAGVHVRETDTIMRGRGDRVRLAEEVLAVAEAAREAR